MANLSQTKREQMIAFLEGLKKIHSDDASLQAFNEIENHIRDKKYGLVWEEHSEEVDDLLKENIPILTEDPERRLCKDESFPWNFIIEGDNLQALYLLVKALRGKVDCIYIDPPYNSGAHDWKYNNNYVDTTDAYRHSKWMSMMHVRLLLAKELLNPEDSVLIVTIDEKEYLRLGCMLEELFPEARIQMISTLTNPKGVSRGGFRRADEYIYFVMLGSSVPQRLQLAPEWSPSVNKSSKQKTTAKRETPDWTSMMRRGSHSRRDERPGLYYPIYVNPNTKTIEKIGEPLPMEIERGKEIEGLVQVLPLRSNGALGCWQVGPKELQSRINQGRVRLGKETSYGYVINYLPDGAYNEVISGKYTIEGRAEDGSLIAYRNDDSDDEMIAPTQWKIATHNSSEYGTTLLNNIIGRGRFPFHKSLYATRDTIKFFVANKPDAIVVDFFAGSGTTFHAVNLLNLEDGGHRRCIMATNNEVSESEEKSLTKKGFKKGDPEWEALGIAKYVNWPRTTCSINGVDINGKPLSGNYLTDSILAVPMSQGFVSNVKYFKCSWTPRKPEEYLLSNVLCLHIKEMIELQNAIEVDNVKNVLILNKEDLKDTIFSDVVRPQIENVWVNQNIIFSTDEMKALKQIGFKYIPREFFGQELREAAE